MVETGALTRGGQKLWGRKTGPTVFKNDIGRIRAGMKVAVMDVAKKCEVLTDNVSLGMLKVPERR